jgi:hypothetical protein
MLTFSYENYTQPCCMAYTNTYVHTIQAKWKQQLAEKQEEVAMANRLAQNADSMFAIGACLPTPQQPPCHALPKTC